MRPAKTWRSDFSRCCICFLSRKYAKVELVFIRHTDQAQEVDEDTFFNGTQAGSTKVLSALAKMHEIIAPAVPGVAIQYLRRAGERRRLLRRGFDGVVGVS